MTTTKSPVYIGVDIAKASLQIDLCGAALTLENTSDLQGAQGYRRCARHL